MIRNESTDFLTVPADRIRHIEVLMTIVGGEIVYRHPELGL